MKGHKGGRPTAADTLILLERRRRVAAAYVRGLPQHQIAAQEDVDQSTISHDLTAIRKEWLASAIMDVGERQSQELARVDAVEAAAWLAWERSLANAEVRQAKTVKTADGERQEASKREEGQSGDPRFLGVILECVAKRCKILGLEGEIKVRVSGSLTLEQRRAAVLDLLRGVSGEDGGGAGEPASSPGRARG